jgi:hypothetical protein
VIFDGRTSDQIERTSVCQSMVCGIVITCNKHAAL